MEQPHPDDPERWAILGVHWHGAAEIKAETSSTPDEAPSDDLPEIAARCLRTPDDAADWVEEITRTYAHRYAIRVPYADPPGNLGTVGDERHLNRDWVENSRLFQRGDSLRYDFVLAHTEPERGFPPKMKYRVHLRVEAVLEECREVDRD